VTIVFQKKFVYCIKQALCFLESFYFFDKKFFFWGGGLFWKHFFSNFPKLFHPQKHCDFFCFRKTISKKNIVFQKIQGVCLSESKICFVSKKKYPLNFPFLKTDTFSFFLKKHWQNTSPSPTEGTKTVVISNIYFL
jgi:hypothetical protein